jgi:hypothetical protein
MPKGSMEAGLDLLRSMAMPGQVFSRRQIAKACGCTPPNIRRIEQTALKKLKYRLREILGNNL